MAITAKQFVKAAKVIQAWTRQVQGQEQAPPSAPPAAPKPKRTGR